MKNTCVIEDCSDELSLSGAWEIEIYGTLCAQHRAILKTSQEIEIILFSDVCEDIPRCTSHLVSVPSLEFSSKTTTTTTTTARGMKAVSSSTTTSTTTTTTTQPPQHPHPAPRPSPPHHPPIHQPPPPASGKDKNKTPVSFSFHNKKTRFAKKKMHVCKIMPVCNIEKFRL